MENEDLKYLKKHYGEKFAHLCRDLFPTLLEKEGLLKKLITDRFPPSRELYDDIMGNSLQDDFKNYIYSFVDVEKGNKEIDTLSPEELLNKAGYKLYPECKTEEDIQSFKKYYADGEKLCTFNGKRLDSCRVWFAVKKNVKDIKREDFKNPSRQDEYGTSVISIQFTKTEQSTLSIKNRYNHRVNNPDATFGNNLDNIIEGLTQAFIRTYNINLIKNEFQDLDIPFYVQAPDGKFYKYTLENNNIYYCLNNIIIDNGKLKTLDKQKYLLFEEFVLDIENKRLYLYDKYTHDTFCESIGEIKNIKRLPSDKGLTIELTPKEGEVVKIELNKNNEIVGYTNLNIREIGDYFLCNNEKLEAINLPKLQSVGNYFLYRNKRLEKLYLPSLQKVESNFLYTNERLQKLDLPNLKTVEDNFLVNNENLEELNLPNLKYVGNEFICYNDSIKQLNMPNLEETGNKFLYLNNKITNLTLFNLQKVRNFFLYSDKDLKELNLPNLEETGSSFIYSNMELLKLNFPKLYRVGDSFLYSNDKLQEINVPRIKYVGNDFLWGNINLQKLDMPNLEKVKNNFLYHNRKLKEFNAPNLEKVSDWFLYFNENLLRLDLPSLESIGDWSCEFHHTLEEVNLPKLKYLEMIIRKQSQLYKNNTDMENET